MITRKIIAHRPHPRYKSLAQEIYECGHTRSVKPQDLGEIGTANNRCVKCIKALPVEIAATELNQLKGRDFNKMLIIERLYQCLDYHLMVTEKSRSSISGNLENIDSAIDDAHSVLRDAGFLLESSSDSNNVESSNLPKRDQKSS